MRDSGVDLFELRLRLREERLQLGDPSVDPLELTLQLRKKAAWEEIERIHVETYHFTFTEIGSEPEKWRPTTRETADHSLPYMLAVTLMDGDQPYITIADEAGGPRLTVTDHNQRG